METVINPGSMEQFTNERSVDISSSEATALYTSALKKYREFCLANTSVTVAERIEVVA